MRFNKKIYILFKIFDNIEKIKIFFLKNNIGNYFTYILNIKI